MHTKQWAVVLLGACLLFSACLTFPKKPMSLEEQIAAYEIELRTATIEENHVPILLGIHAGMRLPAVLHNLTPGAEEGLVYWEWAEIYGEGVHKVKERAYAKLNSEGVDFPFAESLEPSRIYAGIAMRLTFLYKKSTGEWVQRLVLPGILASRASHEAPEQRKPKPTDALRYADENIQLLDIELIPAAERDAAIANAFEMIVLP